MKTDRELLELAAKAYGYRVAYTEPSLFTGAIYQLFFDGEYQVSWEPLTDDGDALRLAVTLGLACSSGAQVYTNNDDLMGAWADRDVMYGTVLYQQVEWSKSTGDPYAATRRAIVRAAAAIGEAMP